MIRMDMAADYSSALRAGVRFFALGCLRIGVLAFLLLMVSGSVFPQTAPISPTDELNPPSKTSCAAGLKFYDSPYFKICYPKRWHVIHGYDVNYAWWVFSKRKHGEQFEIPYIRVIIAKGIAEDHFATQSDSVVLQERTYIKASNEFKDYSGFKLGHLFWRQIVVGPEYDILAWYERIKSKHVKLFDNALDSFWVPPPPRAKPAIPEK